MNVSGYVGHATIVSWMNTIACCLLVGLWVRVRIRLFVWLNNAHVFMLLSVVIELYP